MRSMVEGPGHCRRHDVAGIAIDPSTTPLRIAVPLPVPGRIGWSDNLLDITNHIGYMPHRRVRGGKRVSPLSRIMAGAFGQGVRTYRCEDRLSSEAERTTADGRGASPSRHRLARRAEWLSSSVTSSAVRND